jgi:hypothetical protein
MHFPSRRLAEESRKGITKNNIFSVTTTKKVFILPDKCSSWLCSSSLGPPARYRGMHQRYKKVLRQTKTPA